MIKENMNREPLSLETFTIVVCRVFGVVFFVFASLEIPKLLDAMSAWTIYVENNVEFVDDLKWKLFAPVVTRLMIFSVLALYFLRFGHLARRVLTFGIRKGAETTSSGTSD